MDDTKSMLASKSVWAGIITLLYTLASTLGFLPEGLTETMVSEAFYSVMAILVVIFRIQADKVVTVTGKPKE